MTGNGSVCVVYIICMIPCGVVYGYDEGLLGARCLILDFRFFALLYA